MLKTIVTLFLIILLFSVNYAQQTGEAQGKILVKANTQFSVQLETSAYTDKNTTGDDVKFVLTEDLIGDGVKFLKGSQVFARVVMVEKFSSSNDTAKICVMFDYIKNENDFISFVGTIMAIDPNPEAIKLIDATKIIGSTTLSLKGKDIQLDKGRIFRVKLIKDVTSN